MNNLWQRYLFCTLTVFAGLVFSHRAYATNYDFFYEIESPSNTTPLQLCESDALQKTISYLSGMINDQFNDAKFDLLCLPKWYLLDENEKSKVLLIPYTLGEQITPETLDVNITTLLRGQIKRCADHNDMCIDLERKENQRPKFVQYAYTLTGFQDLTYFKQVLDEIDNFSQELRYLNNPPLAKLIQLRLKSLGYDPGPIDGDPGKATQIALNNWFNDQESLDGDSETNLFFELMTPDFLEIKDDRVSAQVKDSVEPNANDQSGVKNPQPTENAEGSSGDIEDADNSSMSFSQPPNDTQTDLLRQISDLKAEINEQDKKIQEQRGALTEQVEKYTALEAEKDHLKRRLIAATQESISVFWNSLAQNGLKIIGQDPLEKQVELTITESGFSELFCRLTASNSLEQQYEKNLERSRCFRVALKEYDEDTEGNREYDAMNKVLTIPVLEKQSDTITSIFADGLKNFEKEDAPSCYVGLKLNNEENSNDLDASKGQIIQLFLTVSDDEQSPIIQLTDADTVGKKKYQWKNSTLELVDLTPEGETSSCLISTGEPIPIIKKVEDPKDNAQVALVNRNGDVVLKNLKLVKKEEPELHVFMDTLVGPEGDEDYGFNPALVDLNEQETQKIYFEGFLKGVQAFLVENKGIGKLTVHHTIMNKNNVDTIKVAEFIRSDDPLSEYLLLPDEFIETYINSFAAGVEGTFDNKKREYSRILDTNGNSLFVAFGSSGAKPDRVCQTKRKREDYGDNTLIFDVVPAYTFDQLDEEGVVTTLKRGFYLKCTNYGGIAVLRPRGNRESKDVQDVVMDHLSANWRY